MYIRDANGNYVPVPTITGDDGREVELRATTTYIQWRYPDTEWENLISIGDIKGPQGNPGISTYWFTGTAVTGTGSSISATVANSKAHDMYLNTDNANVYEATAANTWDYKCNIHGIQGERGLQGETGATGAQGVKGDTGEGVVSGGSTGQALKKASSTDYDTEWGDIAVDKTATLSASGWSASAPYTQTVNVTGITAAMTPIADIVLSATQATAETELEDWGKVSKIVTGAGNITVTCFKEKPAVALNIIIKVVG